MDLVYTITQNKSIPLRNGRKVWLNGFRQGRLTNPEVDAYSYHRSKSDLDYRLFSPAKCHGSPKGNKRPLVEWLHGGGEGAAPEASDNNETMLRANRGALGFSTAEAQRIFGGAYVVAPQSPTAWMRNGRVFAPMVKGLVDELVERHPIGASRVHVLGCSNGRYMSVLVTALYRDAFASSVPICGTPVDIDAKIEGITTPGPTPPRSRPPRSRPALR